MVEIVKYPLKFGNREQCGCEGLVHAWADSEWISPVVFKGGSTAWYAILAPLINTKELTWLYMYFKATCLDLYLLTAKQAYT